MFCPRCDLDCEGCLIRERINKDLEKSIKKEFSK